MGQGYRQGAVVSPLIANVYLHYLFDLWADIWRRKVAKGDVVVVRYADDLVVGFQHRTEAERFLKEFRERLAKFGSGVPPHKTRPIECVRFAAPHPTASPNSCSVGTTPRAFCSPTPAHASTPLILRKSRMRRRARTDLCGGRSEMVPPVMDPIFSRRSDVAKRGFANCVFRVLQAPEV